MRVIESMYEARELMRQGEVIAYPTEAVYGLGCDPFNREAVKKLLKLKNRQESKGLIVLISDYEQLWPLIGEVPEARLDAVKKTWPGFVTWVFPKSERVPGWISGKHDGVAIRMTAHPIAKNLCEDDPIVSTSTNFSGEPPALSLDDVVRLFPTGVAGVVDGALSAEKKVSDIYDVLSGKLFRGAN